MLKLFGGKSYETKRPQDRNSFTPHLRELVCRVDDTHQVYVDANGIEIRNRGLFKRDDIAVLMSSIPIGGEFPEHEHTVTEWLMVSVGELEITCNGETVVLKAGESLEIQAGHVHTSKALTKVEVLAVTMPADEGFPDGENS